MWLKLPLFLFLCGINLWSMDEEASSEEEDAQEKIISKKKAINGIIIEDAVNLLLKLNKKEKWHPDCVCGTLSWMTIGPLFLIIPGLISLLTGLESEQGPFPPNTTEIGGIKKNNFIVGITSFSIPVASALLSAALFKPIIWLQHGWVNYKNRQMHRHVAANFTRQRDIKSDLNEYDMLVVGPLLLVMADGVRNGCNSCCSCYPCCPNLALHHQMITNLQSRLSPAQALALANFGLDRLRPIAEKKFSAHAKKALNNLSLLTDKNAEELSDALSNTDVIKLFKDEPMLWQATVKNIAEYIFQDNDVQKGLQFSLQALFGDETKRDAEQLTHIISQVRQEASLSSFLLKDISVDGEEDDEDNQEIEFKTTAGEIVAKKKNLVKVSTYFAAAYSNNFSAEKLSDQSGVDQSWVDVLIRVSNEEYITITNKNFFQILEAATYYQIPSLITQCDRFIRDRGFAKEFMEIWWCQEFADKDEDDERNFAQEYQDNSFGLQWQFLRKYGLRESKALQAAHLITRLNGLQIHDNGTLRDMSLFTDKDFELAENEKFDAPGFRNKLSDKKFLAWVWAQGKNISLLKQEIVSFCADVQNTAVVESAWLPIPQDLKTAIAKYND
jgi:hypothetical protein